MASTHLVAVTILDNRERSIGSGHVDVIWPDGPPVDFADVAVKSARLTSEVQRAGRLSQAHRYSITGWSAYGTGV